MCIIIVGCKIPITESFMTLTEREVMSSEAVADAILDMAADVTPDMAADVTPDMVVGVTPDMAVDATPDTVVDVIPDMAEVDAIEVVVETKADAAVAVAVSLF